MQRLPKYQLTLLHGLSVQLSYLHIFITSSNGDFHFVYTGLIIASPSLNHL